MEIFSEAHKNLQMFASDFWPSQEDCEAILREIGIGSTSRINMAEPAVARWFSIIRELIRKNDGGMTRLVTALMRDYPDNDALRTVCSPWIPVPVTKMADVKSIPPSAEGDKTMPTASVEVKTADLSPKEAEAKRFLEKTDLPTGTVLVEEFGLVAKPEPESKPKPKAKPDPESVPVIASSDFEDESGLLLARVDSLWKIMVETEARLVELEFRMNAIHEAWTIVTPLKPAKPPRKKDGDG